MEDVALKEFLRLSDEVDATLTSVPPSFLSVRRQEGDLALFQGSERLGMLTPRAERNLSRITRINYGLIATLPETTLNEALKFQLASMESIGILRSPQETSQIIGFVEDVANYLKYSEVLDDLQASDLAYLRGNPITDDRILFFRALNRITPTDKKEMLIGLHTAVSSTANVASRVSFGVYRLICSNGLIDRSFSEQTIKSNDIKLMRAVFSTYFKSLSIYSGNLAKVIAKSEKIVPDRTRINEYLSLVSFPQTLVNSFKDVINNDNEAPLREAGVDSKITLWDWTCIMSSLAKQLPSLALRESSEKRIFSWINSFYKVLNNN